MFYPQVSISKQRRITHRSVLYMPTSQCIVCIYYWFVKVFVFISSVCWCSSFKSLLYSQHQEYKRHFCMLFFYHTGAKHVSKQNSKYNDFKQLSKHSSHLPPERNWFRLERTEEQSNRGRGFRSQNFAIILLIEYLTKTEGNWNSLIRI